MEKTSKRTKILLTFVILMLVVSIILPFSTAFLSDSDKIDNGTNIYVPNIVYEINQNNATIQPETEDEYSKIYSITNTNGNSKTIAVNLNTNIPVILRVSFLINDKNIALNASFINSNNAGSDWKYHNAIIQPTASTNINLFTTTEGIEEGECMIWIEVMQANRGACENMYGIGQEELPTTIYNSLVA